MRYRRKKNEWSCSERNGRVHCVRDRSDKPIPQVLPVMRPFLCDDIKTIKKYLETIESPESFSHVGNVDEIVQVCRNFPEKETFYRKIKFEVFNDKIEDFLKWKKNIESIRKIFSRLARLYETPNNYITGTGSVLRSIFEALVTLGNANTFKEASLPEYIQVYDYYYKYYQRKGQKPEEIQQIWVFYRDLNKRITEFQDSQADIGLKKIVFDWDKYKFNFQIKIANQIPRIARVEDYVLARTCPKSDIAVDPHSSPKNLYITPQFIAEYYYLSQIEGLGRFYAELFKLYSELKVAHELFHQFTSDWRLPYLREITTEFLTIIYYFQNLQRYNALNKSIPTLKRYYSVVHTVYFKGSVILCLLFDLANLTNHQNPMQTLSNAATFTKNYDKSQRLDENFRFLHKIAKSRFRDDIVENISFETLISMLNTYQKYINGLDRAITREERGEKGKIKKFGLEQEFELFSFNTFQDMFKKKVESDGSQRVDENEQKYIYPSEFQYPYYLAGLTFIKIIIKHLLIKNKDKIEFAEEIKNHLKKKYINMDFIYNIRNKNVGVVEMDEEKIDPEKLPLEDQISNLYNKLGQIEMANIEEKIRIRKEIAELCKKSKNITKLEHQYFSLAMLYEQIDDFKKAIEYYEIANELDNQIYNWDSPSPNAEELKNLMKDYNGDTAKVREWLDNRFQGLNLSHPPDSCFVPEYLRKKE